MNKASTGAIAGSSLINRIAYALFVLSAVYFYFFSEDKMQGIAQLGIALIFDPSDPQVPWQKRPLYQKMWLIAHLSVLLFAFFWEIFA